MAEVFTFMPGSYKGCGRVARGAKAFSPGSYKGCGRVARGVRCSGLVHTMVV